MSMCSFYEQKSSGTQLLFHQQYYAQLYQWTQLEVIHNFFALCMLYARGLKHAARGPHVARQMCLCGPRHH